MSLVPVSAFIHDVSLQVDKYVDGVAVLSIRTTILPPNKCDIFVAEVMVLGYRRFPHCCRRSALILLHISSLSVVIRR